MEDLIKAIEKFTAGTVARGILWVIATLSASIGIEAPDDSVATKIGAFVGAAAAVGLAWVWSRAKDRVWKDEPPKP